MENWPRRRQAAGSQERRAAIQTQECVAIHRQRRDQLRPGRDCHRQSRVSAWMRTCRGMVFASVEHPPVLGGKVKSYDEKAPLQVKGVKQTIPIKPFTPPHHFQPLGGVAVIADNTWAAFQGRKKLNVSWDNGANASYNSDQYKKELQETARKTGKGSAQHRRRGCGVCQGWQDHGGGILPAASGARHHGTARGAGRLSRRQGDGVGAHAEPAGVCRRPSAQSIRHPQRKCDLAT